MATTYKLINKNILGSPSSLISFSSIPATYDDLLLIMSLKTPSTSGDGIYTAEIILKNSSGTSFSNPTVRALRGAGTTVSTFTSTTSYVAGPIPGGYNTANTFNSTELYFPNYTSANAKTAIFFSVAESNDTTYASMQVGAIEWPSTAAISTLEIGVPFTSYVAGSSFYLYGIKKA